MNTISTGSESDDSNDDDNNDDYKVLTHRRPIATMMTNMMIMSNKVLTHTQATMWSKRRAVRPVTLELLKARESIEKMARCAR